MQKATKQKRIAICLKLDELNRREELGEDVSAERLEYGKQLLTLLNKNERMDQMNAGVTISNPTLTKKGKPRRTRKVNVSTEIRTLSEKNGISMNLLRARIFDLGWDERRAATEKPGGDSNRITVGQYIEYVEKGYSDYHLIKKDIATQHNIRKIKETDQYMQYVEAIEKKNKADEYERNIKRAAANGVDRRAYLRRINAGWSVHDAIKKKVKGSQPCKYMQQAKENGINIRTYQTRVSVGWSKEMASTKPARKKEVCR